MSVVALVLFVVHLLLLGFLARTVAGAATFPTQVARGANRRIGVDRTERTQLVTTGPFTVVRNPIRFVDSLIAWELQVRVVEDPQLPRADGSRYAARTPGFLPALGRFPAGPHRQVC